MQDLDKAALDRHITGNWGEDQYPDEETYDCDDCGGGLEQHELHEFEDRHGNESFTYLCKKYEIRITLPTNDSFEPAIDFTAWNDSEGWNWGEVNRIVFGLRQYHRNITFNVEELRV